MIAILIKVKLGGPVIFRQPRPGKDEKIFSLYKFRSITDARDANGELLPDAERLTEFGKKLRASGLDGAIIGTNEKILEISMVSWIADTLKTCTA